MSRPADPRIETIKQVCAVTGFSELCWRLGDEVDQAAW
jgi:hypothetical protein